MHIKNKINQNNYTAIHSMNHSTTGHAGVILLYCQLQCVNSSPNSLILDFTNLFLDNIIFNICVRRFPPKLPVCLFIYLFQMHPPFNCPTKHQFCKTFQGFFRNRVIGWADNYLFLSTKQS